MLRLKLASRDQGTAMLDASAQPVETHLRVTKDIMFKEGITHENAKRIIGVIREAYPKVKSQIQGEAVRVTGPKKDELQAVIALVKQQDFDFPLLCMNFR
jgi:cyclic-di-GMP-binding protein